jgi:Flp pilus assembly protein TadD
MNTTILQASRAARRHLEAGELLEAESLCRRVIEADPHHAGAVHLLGSIAARRGRRDLAIDCLRATIRLDPDQPDAQVELGRALRDDGDLRSCGGFAQIAETTGSAFLGHVLTYRALQRELR